MAVGPQDFLDAQLVAKYANIQVNNLKNVTMVDPQKMMSAMNDYANVSKSLFNVSNRITNACAKLNAQAKYQTW